MNKPGASTHRVGFILEPALNADEIGSLLALARSSFRFLSNYDYREEDEEHIVNNGPSIRIEEEVLIKIIRGKEIHLASGKEAGSEVLCKILVALLDCKNTPLTVFRIKSFDFMLLHEIPYAGNQYKILASVLYNNGTIGEFYQAVLEEDSETKIRDNDVHILLSLSRNRLMFLKVAGQTSRKEIDLDEYSEKKIQLQFGVLQEKVSEIEAPLTEAIQSHVASTEALFEKTVLNSVFKGISSAAE